MLELDIARKGVSTFKGLIMTVTCSLSLKVKREVTRKKIDYAQRGLRSRVLISKASENIEFLLEILGGFLRIFKCR